MPKILHVADLHLDQDWYCWVATNASRFDLLIIAGDLQNAFSNTGMHEQARALTKWLLSLETPTIVCSGNHDHWPRHSRWDDAWADSGWIRNLRGQNRIIGVDGDHLSFGGLNIVVNGWQQLPVVTQPVDLVVSHAPPEGVACASGAERRDVGDPDLWSCLANHPPALILSGHVHSPISYSAYWPQPKPTTLVLVPGVIDSEVPAHWIINTATAKAFHSDAETVVDIPQN